jgi:hypothetical protein
LKRKGWPLWTISFGVESVGTCTLAPSYEIEVNRVGDKNCSLKEGTSFNHLKSSWSFNKDSCESFQFQKTLIQSKKQIHVQNATPKFFVTRGISSSLFSFLVSSSLRKHDYSTARTKSSLRNQKDDLYSNIVQHWSWRLLLWRINCQATNKMQRQWEGTDRCKPRRPLHR